jgi:hypothetical protein
MNLKNYYICGTGEEIFNVKNNSVVFDDEWSLDEEGMESLVDEISSRLQNECIVIGECHNINVDPYTYLVYYLGGEVVAHEYSFLDDEEYWGDESDDEWDEEYYLGEGKMWGMIENAPIYDLPKCLTYYSLYGPGFSEEEQKYIQGFGIFASKSDDGIVFENNIPNFGLPNSIELAGTQYEGRIGRIEKVSVGDTVSLVREPNNKYDANAIDVQNAEGSLGHLSADACAILAPLLDNDGITYTAKIDSVTPLSKRSNRCKNALISIHIDAIKKQGSKENAVKSTTESEVETTSECENKVEANSVTVQKDYFTEYAAKVEEVVAESASTHQYNAEDKVIYDENKRVISIFITLNQNSDNNDIVEERIETAETLKENDEVSIVPIEDRWDVKDKSGHSLGEPFFLLAKQSIPYISRIEFRNARIANIIPKSKRQSDDKYALVSIKVDIVERKLPKQLSEDDIAVMRQFAYFIDGENVKLLSWIGEPTTKKVVIPASIEGKSVVAIDSDLFTTADASDLGMIEQLEELVISEGIKRLEANTLSFIGFEDIKRIVLPSSIEYISDDVFTTKEGLKDLYLAENQNFCVPKDSYADKFLKAYEPDICANVDELNVINTEPNETDKAFKEAEEELKTLNAFETVDDDRGIKVKFKGYGLNNFKEKTVSIPARINGKVISVFSLDDMPNCIQTIIIPATIEYIDFYDFGFGYDLKHIEISDENNNFWTDGKSIFTKDKKTLLRFMVHTDTQYSIPEGTEVIGASAFKYRKNLEKLVIPSSVHTIENYAFGGCKKLKTIEGIENVITLGEGICTSDDAYHSHYERMETIPFVAEQDIVIVGNNLIKYDVLNDRRIVIPNGIERICKLAFGSINKNDNVEEIVLPDSVKVIEDAAFARRNKLKKINIPDGVEVLNKHVFSKCDSLESIEIPASVRKIEIGAFPQSDEYGWGYKDEKSELVAINVSENNEIYCSIDGMLLSKDKTELLFVPRKIAKDGIKIPNSVEIIGKSVFSGCNNLSTIILPDSVTTIGAYAFIDCKKLKHVNLPKGLKSVDDRAFKGIELKVFVLPEGIEYIGAEAFAGISRKKVVVPKSVKNIGWGAFSGAEEIVIYDTIVPDAKDCSEPIDIQNHKPNSIVGFIGIGSLTGFYGIGPIHGDNWARVEYHNWNNYTITVMSAETDKVKYKVWMGYHDDATSEYLWFLAYSWGRNATFDFVKLDNYFKDDMIFREIMIKDDKKKIAEYRLQYPINLTEENKRMYEAYLTGNS